MDRFWHNWAHVHRNVQGWSAAIFLLVMLAWLLLGTANKRISRAETQAQVITTSLLKSSQISGGLHLKMADGKTLKLFVSANPFPKVGDTVPLIVEQYEDGSSLYMLDQQRWFLYKVSH